MAEPIHADLVLELLAYAEEHKLSKSQTGKVLASDPNLIFQLESGRELRRQTERRLRERMSQPPQEEGAA